MATPRLSLLVLLALGAAAAGLSAHAQPARGGYQGNGGTVRCESNDRRERSCTTPWRSARLVRQLSSAQCVEGSSWYSRQGEIHVRNGCRGEFAEARGNGSRGNGWGPARRGNSGYAVTCSSDDNRMRTCAWDRRQGRPYVIQQLSKTRCVEGRTWGIRGTDLWVNDGCRARFGVR